MRLDVGARDGGVEGVRQLIEGTRLKRQAGEEKGADSSNMPACQHASKEPSECMGGGPGAVSVHNVGPNRQARPRGI
jgi:hypothetical protein